MGAVARGAGDGPGVQVNTEVVLGEWPFGAGGGSTLMSAWRPALFHLLEELAGSVGGIAVDRRLAAACFGPGSGAGLISGQQVSEQHPGRLRVAAVARGDTGSGDDLAIGSTARWALDKLSPAVYLESTYRLF